MRMGTWKGICKYAYFVFFCLLLFSGSAQAYIDPATTSYIIQIVAAFFITLGVVFSAFTTRAKMALTKLRMKLLEESIRRKAGGAQGKDPQGSNLAFPAGSLGALVQDSRPAKERLALALAAAFSLAFTFFLFGPYDLFMGNRNIMPMTFGSLRLPLLLAGLAVFALLLALLVLLRGRLFDMAVSWAVGLLLAGYLQGNFLNLNLGQLTGEAIHWEQYLFHGLVNTLVWLVVAALPSILLYFSKILWKGVCLIAPSLLVAVQVVSLLVTFSSTGLLHEVTPLSYLSVEGLYDVAPKDNIIVILLDRLDERYIEDILQEDPDFFANLDGFTHYTNNISSYGRTYPSVVNLLTGAVTDFGVEADTFVTEAYRNSTFLSDIKKQGYDTKLYMAAKYGYTNIVQLRGLADNISSGEMKTDSLGAIKDFWKLSLFRYAPHVMKPGFWMYTGDFSQLVQMERDPQPYVAGDVRFYENLEQQGLRVSGPQKNFVYYHLEGMHNPFFWDENGQEVPADQTNRLRHTMGSFKKVGLFLDQLRQLGVYEDANIIITGDHGASPDIHELDQSLRTGLLVKRRGETGPLKMSNAPLDAANFRASIIEMAEMETDAYGPAYWEVPEDAPVVRHFYYRINSMDGNPGYLVTYEVYGDAKDFANWKKLEVKEILFPHG